MISLNHQIPEVVKWIEKGLPKSTIFRRLSEKNFDHSDSNYLYLKGLEIYKVKFIKKNRPKWIIASSSYLLLYLFLFPVTACYNSPYLIGFILGIPFGLMLYQTLFVFQSVNELIEGITNSSHPKNAMYSKVILALPIGAIIFSCYFNFVKINYEFKNYGAKVQGNISGGYQETTRSRKGTTNEYSLTYTYFTKNNSKKIGACEVNYTQYNQSYLHKKIYVLYSSRHDEMTKIID